MVLFNTWMMEERAAAPAHGFSFPVCSFIYMRYYLFTFYTNQSPTLFIIKFNSKSVM